MEEHVIPSVGQKYEDVWYPDATDGRFLLM